MDKRISAYTVTETWQRIAQLDAKDVPELAEQLHQEQPVLLTYLLYLEDSPFTSHEKEFIFYIGVVLWQMMRQSPRRLRKVTRRKLEKAEAAIYESLEMMASDSEADFASAVLAMVENYSEPEVLRYLIEVIMKTIMSRATRLSAMNFED